METIEERAKRANWGLHVDSFDAFNEETKNAILRFTTEQDRIARQEERDRCIKIAQEWNCKVACNNGLACKPDYKERCVILEGIRKSMEE